MKKHITLIITMLIMLSAQAQKLEAYFDNAIKEGRNDNGKGYYTAQFNGKKNVKINDAIDFMNKKGYILVPGERVISLYGHDKVRELPDGIDVRCISRFGNDYNVMDLACFVQESELESFIANTPLLNTWGKAIIHSNSRKEIIDVFWSGEVKNGWISGKGMGYTRMGYNQQKKYDNYFIYIINGNFIDGIPYGNCEVTTTTFSIYDNVSGRPARVLSRKRDKKTEIYNVGNLNNGYRTLSMNGKYGFIDAQGNIIASCKYGEIVQEFNNAGYAIVTDPSDGNQEIKINTSGTKIGYSDKQLQINEEKRLAKIAEEKRKEEERIQKEREKALAEAREEELRQERIRNAKEGDEIHYYLRYSTETGIIFHVQHLHDMTVICFVEKNVDNGERLQVRVGRVKSSEGYVVPEIDGIQYSKGDVLWIRPLENKNWHMK